MGIDPGSTTLGVTIIEYDVITLEITKTYSHTLNAGRIPLNENDVALNNERYARIFLLANILYELFREYGPNFVVSESPFLKRRFPLAFAVLTEVVFAIRMALHRYDPTIKLELVDPPTAKKAVGAIITKGKEQKNPVRDALIKLLPDLNYDPTHYEQEFLCLDEHSIDSIAIAYWKWVTLTTE